MDTKAQKASSLDAEKQEALNQQTRRELNKIWQALAFTTFILFCFASIGALQPRGRDRHNYYSECLHALGGGRVGDRGSLLHYDPSCTDDLRTFFRFDYFAEVRSVSDEAIAYFRQQLAAQGTQQDAPVGSRGTVIFDIDETALSNMDGFFPSDPPSWWQRLWGSAPQHPPVCARPHLEFVQQWAREQQHGAAHSGCRKLGAGTMMGGGEQQPQDQQQQPRGRPGATAAEAEAQAVLSGAGSAAAAAAASLRVPLCSSPPLKATLDLYNFLVDNGYTVVFLTGRSEDARADTAANLEAAGYGGRCGDAANATAALQQAQQQQQQAPEPVRPCWMGRLWNILAGLPADSVPSHKPQTQKPRCYAELLMREVGDSRLASVFKAEARAALATRGSVPPLVGNIGDQFSDLTGEAAAPASWKLPNPVYTLL